MRLPTNKLPWLSATLFVLLIPYTTAVPSQARQPLVRNSDHIANIDFKENKFPGTKSTAVSKILEHLLTAFSKIKTHTSLKTTPKGSKGTFFLTHSQAEAHQPYKAQQHNTISSGNHKNVLERNAFIHSESNLHAVHESNVFNGPSFGIDPSSFLPQFSKHRLIFQKAIALKTIPETMADAQTKLRFARNVQRADNFQNNGNVNDHENVTVLNVVSNLQSGVESSITFNDPNNITIPNAGNRLQNGDENSINDQKNITIDEVVNEFQKGDENNIGDPENVTIPTIANKLQNGEENSINDQKNITISIVANKLQNGEENSINDQKNITISIVANKLQNYDNKNITFNNSENNTAGNKLLNSDKISISFSDSNNITNLTKVNNIPVDEDNNVNLEYTSTEDTTNLPYEPSTGTNIKDPSAGTNVKDPSTGTNVKDPSTGTNVKDPSTGTNVVNPNTTTTTKNQIGDVLHKPAQDDVISNDFSSEAKIQLDPIVRDVVPAPVILKPTTEITFHSTTTEISSTFQVERNQMKDNHITNTGSLPDSEDSLETSHKYDSPVTQEDSKTEAQISERTTNFRKSFDASQVSTTPRILLGKTNKVNDKDKTKDSFNDIFLQISLSSSGDSMVVSWTFASNDTRITGFQVSYRMNNRENYDSSSLGTTVRSFTLHSLHEDENYFICVHAMINNRTVQNSCAEWSKSSLKIVTGALAGTIFLIPCVIVVAWILYKDRKLKMKRRLQEEKDETDISEEQLLSHKKPGHSLFHGPESSNRLSPEKEHETTASLAYSNKSLNKPLQDTGHENPCEHAADDTTDDDDIISGPWKRMSREAAMKSRIHNCELSSQSSVGTTASKNSAEFVVVKKDLRSSKDRLSDQNISHAEIQSPPQGNIQRLTYAFTEAL